MSLGTPAAIMEGLEPYEMVKQKDPDYMLKFMDKYCVDIACLLPVSMMDTTGYTTCFCSNGEMGQSGTLNP